MKGKMIDEALAAAAALAAALAIGILLHVIGWLG